MKILVVEDEVFSRKKLQKIMESFGECEAVDNGEDALKAAVSQNPPDLILLDIGLPGIDGYEVCERLKADSRTKDIPVIFLSAHTEIDEKTRGFEKGAVDYITKPFHKAEAKARVQTHLTLKKLREEGLQESEEKYRNLFENLYDVYYRTDDKGIITLLSPSVEKYLGYTPDELIGQNMKYFYVKPQRRKEFLSLLLKNEYVDNFEEQLKCKDNSVIWVSVNAKLLKNEEGKFLGVEGIARDVSERKRMEDEKAKVEAQLQQAQKMEAIGTLAGGIAHDFNNILFPIIGYAEMMLGDLPEDNPHKKNTTKILQGAKRASDLVKQILTFSRQADQKLTPLMVPLVIKEVLQLITSSLPTTIEIKQHINNKCGLVMADFTQVHQIAMNLVTNAYQAMEDEGGKLEVTLEEVELGIDDLTDQSMTPGAYVCLTVADTGPGMDQLVISRIFDPYFSTKEDGKGTGLGLAVVHGIVKSYKGDIRVYSKPGEGTAFHVYLPVTKSRFETDQTEAIEPVPRGTEQILLVDDEEAIVHMEKQMLERLGYQVTARTSSIEALEAFRDSPDKFDLVITDMTMPNMAGIQLSQKLLEIRPDIPIIICTGFSTKIDNAKATAVGIRGYVMKPVGMNEIGKKIREVLDKDPE